MDGARRGLAGCTNPTLNPCNFQEVPITHVNYRLSSHASRALTKHTTESVSILEGINQHV